MPTGTGGPSAAAFGAALRHRRTTAGVSLTAFSELIKYSKGYLSKVESGSKAPSVAFARTCDAVLHAGGALASLVDRPHGRARDIAFRPTETAQGVDATARTPPAGRFDDMDAERSLEVIDALFENLRSLAQILGPTPVVPMLTPQITALRQIALRATEQLGRKALVLAARLAEYTGWMAQEMGDDMAALKWTDEAAVLAEATGEVDLVAITYVRRANIALYQDDAFGTISNASQAQTLPCGARVRGLAAQREAQGHALAGNQSEFDRCIRVAMSLWRESQSAPGDLGPTKIPDSLALTRGWGLHDLGRSKEAADILGRLFGECPRTSPNAWARIGARYALALASCRELELCCEVCGSLLPVVGTIESATIRADVRRLARVLNRWGGNERVARIIPQISAALTPFPASVTS